MTESSKVLARGLGFILSVLASYTGGDDMSLKKSTLAAEWRMDNKGTE